MADKNIADIVLRLVDKVTGPIAKVAESLKTAQDQINKAAAPVRQVTSAFQALKDASGFNRISDAFNRVGSAASRVRNEFLGILATLGAVGFAAYGFFKTFIYDSTLAANELGDFSRSIGVSIQGIQELRYISEQAGSSTEVLDGALRKYTKAVGLAKAGQGPLYGLLMRVNPQLLRQATHAKTAQASFELMLRAIGQLKSPQQQVALATVAFGRGAESLVAVAKEGPAAFQKLRDEFDKFGGVTEEQVEKSDNFIHSLDRLKTVLNIIKTAFGAELGAAIQPFIDEFTKFLVANKVQIQEFITAFAKRVPDALKAFGEAAKNIYFALSPLLTILGYIATHSWALQAVFYTLSGLIVGKFLIAIVGLIGSLGTLAITVGGALVNAFLALGAALGIGLWPLTLIVLAVGALIAAGIAVYVYWEDVVGIFKEVILVVKDIIWWWGKMIDKVTSLPTKALQFFGVGGDPTLKSGAIPAPNVSEQRNRSQSEVKVTFDNMPKGARVFSKTDKDSILDLSMGYAMQPGL